MTDPTEELRIALERNDLLEAQVASLRTTLEHIREATSSHGIFCLADEALAK